jgi:hypothetical protein
MFQPSLSDGVAFDPFSLTAKIRAAPVAPDIWRST